MMVNVGIYNDFFWVHMTRTMVFPHLGMANELLDPENHQARVETSLPSRQGHVNLLEGSIW